MKKLAVHTHKLLDSFFKYAVAAVLIFIPLYPKFPLFTLPFTYVQIRAEDFLIVALWGIFFLRLLVKRSYKLPPLSFQIGVFIIIGLISSLSAILVTKNVLPTAVLLHFFRRIEYLSIFFLVYEASKNENNRRYFFGLFIIPIVGVFLYGLAQIYLGAPVISTMNVESSKGVALTLRPGVPLSSTFAGHYDLAVYLTMMLTVLTAVLCSVKSRLKILLTFLSFLATLWLFMQAGSRIGLLGLFLSISIVSILYKKYLFGLILLITMFAFIATSPGYIDRFKSIFNVITARFSQVIIKPVYAAVVSTPTPTPTPEALRAIQQDTSTSIRFDVEWPRAIRSFYKNPFLGTGYSSISLSTDNDYLRALGETGVLGFLAFISVIIGLFLRLINNFKKQVGQDRLLSVSAIGILVVFCTTAIFLDVFESSKIAILFWAFMGLSLSTKS
jgi:O-antigen ligase